MADNILYPDTIEDQPFPGQEAIDTSVSQAVSAGGISTEKIKDNPTPKKIIAHETIGSALNTKTKRILAVFEFTEHGAIQIGKYVNGVSGDLRFTPNGIIARDLAGLTTFAIDGTTGDAVFKGTIQAESIISGSLVTGKVIVGNENIVIDGENSRILINNGNEDQILIGYLEGMF